MSLVIGMRDHASLQAKRVRMHPLRLQYTLFKRTSIHHPAHIAYAWTYMLLLEISASSTPQVLSCCPGGVACSHMLLTVQALKPDAGDRPILREGNGLQVGPKPCPRPLRVLFLPHKLIIQLVQSFFWLRARHRAGGPPSGTSDFHLDQKGGT